MAFGALGYTVSFVVVIALGASLGLGTERLLGSNMSARSKRLQDSDDLQVSVNTAILYATVALLLATVVSEWPPEGQPTLPILEDLVFFGVGFAGSFIVGRVTYLLWTLESYIVD